MHQAARYARMPELFASMLATVRNNDSLLQVLGFLWRYYEYRVSRARAVLQALCVPVVVLTLGAIVAIARNGPDAADGHAQPAYRHPYFRRVLLMRARCVTLSAKEFPPPLVRGEGVVGAFEAPTLTLPRRTRGGERSGFGMCHARCPHAADGFSWMC